MALKVLVVVDPPTTLPLLLANGQVINAFPQTESSGGGGIDQLTQDVLAGPGTGSVPALVVRFQDRPVNPAAPPNDSSVYVWDGTEWTARQLTADDIAAGFSITSFTGGSTVETGATVNNPTFAASYSSPPTSAVITNTDGQDSPHNLIAPFTGATIAGAFTRATPGAITFTLTAHQGSLVKTATQAITFDDRSFSGLGTAGGTAATASGNNANLVTAAGTLTGTGSDGGLFGSIVGVSFGPFTPSAQKIYVLTPHTSSPHVFHDQNGFLFSMLAPTTFSFTNQNGAVLSYDLYESTNLLSTTFTLTCVS